MEVDQAFVQPMLKPTIAEADGIPTIDISSIKYLDDLSNTKAVDALVAEIGDACIKWGFFQVVNHGIPLEVLQEHHRVGREFFALSKEEKRKVRRDEDHPLGYSDNDLTDGIRDWKELYDYVVKEPMMLPVSADEPEPKPVFNQWPEHPSNLKEIALRFGRETEKMAFKLLELCSLSLGLAPKRLHAFFEEPTNFHRLNHYSPCSSPHLVLGVGEHKDMACLTIISQDDVGGLEVRRKSDGEWVKVKPIPGAYVVNVGNVMEAWTNGKYESVEHRVMVNSNKERVSTVFGFYPSHSVNVKPLEEFVDEKNCAKYKEYNWGLFLAAKKRKY